jgi:hypothetical protein
MIHEDPLERARDEAFSMRLIRLGLPYLDTCDDRGRFCNYLRLSPRS